MESGYGLTPHVKPHLGEHRPYYVRGFIYPKKVGTRTRCTEPRTEEKRLPYLVKIRYRGHLFVQGIEHVEGNDLEYHK